MKTPIRIRDVLHENTVQILTMPMWVRRSAGMKEGYDWASKEELSDAIIELEKMIEELKYELEKR